MRFLQQIPPLRTQGTTQRRIHSISLPLLGYSLVWFWGFYCFHGWLGWCYTGYLFDLRELEVGWVVRGRWSERSLGRERNDSKILKFKDCLKNDSALTVNAGTNWAGHFLIQFPSCSSPFYIFASFTLVHVQKLWKHRNPYSKGELVFI